MAGGSPAAGSVGEAERTAGGVLLSGGPSTTLSCMPELVAVERYPGVAVIRLMRTEQRNAFNRELDVAVSAALQEFDADPEVKCVVLTGSGTAFSAGADFNEAVAAMDEGSRGQGLALTYAALAAFRKPIIAAVNGSAYGGGALVATMCDIRIASEDAVFRFPGTAYGLVVGGAQLPRIVGAAVAKDLLFTARVVHADEAERIGLVNRVVPRAEIDAAALEMAEAIAQNSLGALIATKEVVDRGTLRDDAVRLEGERNAELRRSPEHQERFRAAARRTTSR